MRRRFRHSGPSTFGWGSQHETHDAELFFRDLFGATELRHPARGEGKRAAPLRIDPLEQADWRSSRPPHWSAEQYQGAAGLPADDEEAWEAFDEEFVEPDASPNGANAPFAPLLSGAGHWPIITSDPQGRTVSYRTASGAWVGRRLRSFGANRSNGARYHVGVDLFGRFGDSVVAIEDGRIVSFFAFCCGENKTSWALLVQHANLVVNYGEVAPDSLRGNGLAVGSNVRAGQVIARVGRNPGGSSMIHFEAYSTGTTRSYRWLKGRNRPARLFNPTRLLLQLQTQGLPRPASTGGTATAESADDIRARAREYIDREVPVGKVITSDGRTKNDFVRLTGMTHKQLVASWKAQEGKPKKKRKRLTSCNSFVGVYSTTLGLPNLGRFDLVRAYKPGRVPYLNQINKLHAWVIAAPDVRPKYGDIFLSKGLHMGISLDFVGEKWNTVDGGQGGPRYSADDETGRLIGGRDIVRRNERIYDSSKLQGWIDIERFVGATASSPGGSN